MKHLENNKRKDKKEKINKIKILKRIIFITLVVSALVLSNLISQKLVDYLLTLDRSILVNGFNIILITVISAIIFKD